MALWLTAVHRALYPQAPTHGSEHFCWMQALLLGHSALRTHSGRQLGAVPMYPGLQEQASCPLTSLQMELGPQGSGTHGMCGAGGLMISGSLLQLKNGSPLYPLGQLQMGL